jgi:hypothetical protein
MRPNDVSIGLQRVNGFGSFHRNIIP